MSPSSRHPVADASVGQSSSLIATGGRPVARCPEDAPPTGACAPRGPTAEWVGARPRAEAGPTGRTPRRGTRAARPHGRMGRGSPPSRGRPPAGTTGPPRGGGSGGGVWTGGWGPLPEPSRGPGFGARFRGGQIGPRNRENPPRGRKSAHFGGYLITLPVGTRVQPNRPRRILKIPIFGPRARNSGISCPPTRAEKTPQNRGFRTPKSGVFGTPPGAPPGPPPGPLRDPLPEGGLRGPLPGRPRRPPPDRRGAPAPPHLDPPGEGAEPSPSPEIRQTPVRRPSGQRAPPPSTRMPPSVLTTVHRPVLSGREPRCPISLIPLLQRNPSPVGDGTMPVHRPHEGRWSGRRSAVVLAERRTRVRRW